MTECRGGSTSDQTSGGSGFVLVVDNDAQSLVILAMILHRIGYRVCTANFADKALEMAHYSPPSLVITEMNLRGMTGLALMHRLRDSPRTADVPVIVMSKETTAEFTRNCRQAGVVGTLPKPVQADELYQAVHRIIDPQSRREDIRIPALLPASVNERLLDAEAGECVVNLSVNGMFVRTQKDYPVNEIVRMELSLHGEIVTADARVVYSHTGEGDRGHNRGMGLQFLTMSPGGRETIRRFIHKEVTHGLAPGMT